MEPSTPPALSSGEPPEESSSNLTIGDISHSWETENQEITRPSIESMNYSRPTAQDQESALQSHTSMNWGHNTALYLDPSPQSRANTIACGGTNSRPNAALANGALGSPSEECSTAASFGASGRGSAPRNQWPSSHFRTPRGGAAQARRRFEKQERFSQHAIDNALGNKERAYEQDLNNLKGRHMKAEYANKSLGIFGCKHYHRKCKVYCSMCKAYHACRQCHDALVDGQHDDLTADMVTNLLCMVCGTEQNRIVSHCVNPKCGVKFADRFCLECRLFDSTPGVESYHCNDCGVCRRGKKSENYHCFRCGTCVRGRPPKSSANGRPSAANGQVKANHTRNTTPAKRGWPPLSNGEMDSSHTSDTGPVKRGRSEEPASNGTLFPANGKVDASDISDTASTEIFSPDVPEHVCQDLCVRDGACAICLKSMFRSSEISLFLPCGHCIHKPCYEEHSKHSYRCPVCSRAMGDMSRYYAALDGIWRTERSLMSEGMRTRKVQILCNDCGNRSSTGFHYEHYKCMGARNDRSPSPYSDELVCGSFNTRRVG